MSEQLLEYEHHFLPYQIVRIVFFVDQAIRPPETRTRITHLTRDLLELELEEEQITETVSISLGDILELRSGKDGHSFRCRALLVSGTTSRYLLVRLVGNVIYEELREYFRIDTYLPLRYTSMPGWDLKSVRRKWLDIIDSRTHDINQAVGFIAKQEPTAVASSSSTALLPLQYEPPVAANIGGGGLRTCILEDLEQGSFALLEIFLPGLQPRVIDVAGEVLSSEPVTIHSQTIGYSIPFKFICIDERDRDTIISHIQNIQQKQIRQMAEDMPVLKRSLNQLSSNAASQFNPLRQRLVVATLIIFACITIFSLISYYRKPVKGEVQLIFEGGLRKYLEQLPIRER